jgi:hypothetical protein
MDHMFETVNLTLSNGIPSNMDKKFSFFLMDCTGPTSETSPFRNGSHLPTTQCACADFVDFATQRNGKIYRRKSTFKYVR